MKLLTTGSGSGLGKYLFEKLGGTGFTRSSAAEMDRLRSGPAFDAIIHCAFNSSRPVTNENLDRFLEDNIALTRTVLSIPHKKIIYISSIDVYPKTLTIHREDETIDLDAVDKFYGLFKLAAEAVIKKTSPNHLILRCTALLGAYSRKNSLIKIMTDEPCVLPLTGDSVFNYVRHEDVAEVVSAALKNSMTGVYNVLSSENITLEEAAGLLGKKVRFGSHTYYAGHISNQKIVALFPAFKQTSRDVIRRFMTAGMGAPKGSPR